jgi:hypothetical protein
LSLVSAPVYDGSKVTITMKGWKWSNGEQVTAQDVVFWIHMMQAVSPAKLTIWRRRPRPTCSPGRMIWGGWGDGGPGVRLPVPHPLPRQPQPAGISGVVSGLVRVAGSGVCRPMEQHVP